MADGTYDPYNLIWLPTKKLKAAKRLARWLATSATQVQVYRITGKLPEAPLAKSLRGEPLALRRYVAKTLKTAYQCILFNSLMNLQVEYAKNTSKRIRAAEEHKKVEDAIMGIKPKLGRPRKHRR